MRLRFTGGETPCTVFGFTFAPGVWVSDPGLRGEHLEALKANPTFEVEMSATASKDKAIPAPETLRSEPTPA